jgi:hypothetical protein
MAVSRKARVAGGWGSVCSAVCGICMNPVALGLTYSLRGVLRALCYAVNVYNIRMDYETSSAASHLLRLLALVT